MSDTGFIITCRSHSRDEKEGFPGIPEVLCRNNGYRHPFFTSGQSIRNYGFFDDAAVFNTREEAEAIASNFHLVWCDPVWSFSDIEIVEVRAIYRQGLSHWERAA